MGDGKNSCDNIRELFSPRLDGEISREENSILEDHLLRCESCSREFDLWRRINGTLNSYCADEAPSPDFTAGVMSRLERDLGQRTGQASKRKGLAGFWRTPAAAAAAALVLFTGSWGISVAVKSEKPQSAVVVLPDTVQADTNNSGNNSASDKESNGAQTQTPAVPEQTAAKPEEGNNTATKTQTAAPVAASPGIQAQGAALLSEHRDILSTILKLSVNNSDNAVQNAIAMAKGLGGGGQVMTSQKKDNGELVIVRLSVPRDKGNNLVAQLSGLGGIIDRADEQKDISTSYNEAQNRLNEINAKMAGDITTQEREQLEAEASGLKRQITSWNSEMDSYVVILWLESK